MSGLARGFFASSIFYAILGMGIGLMMAATYDHQQMPTHAHTMVIGWLSFAVFGLTYNRFPELETRLWAKLHFWVAQASTLALVIALFGLYSGNPAIEPLAIAGSVGYLVSFICFGLAMMPALRGK